jgi:3-oxoacyl-[acyl-carrier protein] reductase
MQAFINSVPSKRLQQKTFTVSLTPMCLGLLLSTQGALKHFNGAGGSVINIGSAVTAITPVQSSIYTATKGAVDSITHVLAKELGW